MSSVSSAPSPACGGGGGGGRVPDVGDGRVRDAAVEQGAEQVGAVVAAVGVFEEHDGAAGLLGCARDGAVDGGADVQDEVLVQEFVAVGEDVRAELLGDACCRCGSIGDGQDGKAAVRDVGVGEACEDRDVEEAGGWVGHGDGFRDDVREGV